MKNVSVEMNNESLVAVAGLFDIPTENVEKETLVSNINAAIEELKTNRTSRAKTKWFEAEGANPYKEGDTVKIVAGNGLIGRFAEVMSPSSKTNAVKAFLLTPKEGTRQGTLITLDFENIELSTFEPVAAKVKKVDETPAPTASEEGEKVEGTNEEPSGEEVSEEVVNEESSEEVVSEEVVSEEQPVSEDSENTSEEAKDGEVVA